MGSDRRRGRHGKLRWLYQLINVHHAALEADFDRVPGWDLLDDVWRGQVTTRKLWLRIMNLPRDSAFMQSAFPVAMAWGETEYLIAGLIDVLLAVNGSKQTCPRPGAQAAVEARTQARAKRWEERVAERRAKAEREGAAT